MDIQQGSKGCGLFVTLVWCFLQFKMFHCGGSEIVITFLQATTNTNGKQVLKSTKFELFTCIHLTNIWPKPHQTQKLPMHVVQDMLKACFSSQINKIPRFQSKSRFLFSQKEAVGYPTKTPTFYKTLNFSPLRKKKKQYSYPPPFYLILLY